MSDLNSLSITGRLGSDAQVRFTNTSGDAVTNFRVAVSGREKADGEWKDSVTWFGVTLFGRRAESLAKYLVKGTRVAVVGRVALREYTNRRDGEVVKTLEVIAHDVSLMGSPPTSRKPEQEDISFPDDGDEIPF